MTLVLVLLYLIEKTLISILFKLTDEAPVISLAPHPIISTPLPLYSSMFVLGRLGFLQMSVTAADFKELISFINMLNYVT
jgi:hypothetical protein